MDFFEHQHQARRRTAVLVVFFILASAGVVFLICLAAWVALQMYMAYYGWRHQAWTDQDVYRLLFWVAVFTGGLIVTVTLYKVYQLRLSGGEGIAAMLGGELIDPDTSETGERRLVNIVEEMAIASGLAVPPVCVLRGERGINAFAAGYNVDDAIVGVTEGAVELLTREELQGVVGHEFSHILNGDMRLNIRLIGVIHGIIALSLTGKFLLRLSAGGRSGRSRGSPQLAILGLILLLIGALGALFGNVIKAAVSRQREFLADAASVQFTRNPHGLAGALVKIGGHARGSLLLSPNADVASHMYFSDGVVHWLRAVFATHPALDKRIRLLDPQWDGSYPIIEAPAPGFRPDASVMGVAGPVEPEEPPPLRTAIDQTGRLDRAHLKYARRLIDGLPEKTAEAARRPASARAVIFALLIDRNEDVRRPQLDLLKDRIDPGLYEQSVNLLPEIEKLSPKARLPLIDLTLPALRKLILTPSAYHEFKEIVEALIKADRKVALFEWTLHRIVLGHLQRRLVPGKDLGVKYTTMGQVAEPCSVVLSHLARNGSLNPVEVEHAFREGAALLGPGGLVMKSGDEATLSALSHALTLLKRSSPLLKKQILTACATCISADRTVTISEAELLRAIADSLDCPIPPLLPGQPLV